MSSKIIIINCHEFMVITWKFVLNPNRSLGRLFNPFHFFRSVYAISAFLSASWPHPCLAVARYVFASDEANLLGTNTNLA